MARLDKIGVNPLPWVLTEAGFTLDEATLTAALTDLGAVGFDALHADVPDGWSPARYLAFLAEHGFRPAPGYFSADFSDASNHSAIREAAKVHAGKLAALGLAESFTASDLTPARIARPASGADADADRTAIVAEGLAAAADAARGEGVVHALHPHIGSHVETEAEVRQVLDATDGSALAFGPDTGHLRWAGAVPDQLIGDYASRVAAVHLKDVDAAAATAAADASADYWQATGDFHVWTEPGRGAIDFAQVFNALPTDFDGWFVLEVDVPNIGTAKESAAVSRANLLAMPYFQSESAS